MTPDSYRTRIYTHYVQAREQALAPETLAGLAPRAHALRYGDLTHEMAFTRTSLAQLLLSSGFGAVRCFEDAPVVHGAKSALRWLLWVSAVCCGFTLPPKRTMQATRTSFRRICWRWRADDIMTTASRIAVRKGAINA